MEKHNQTVQKGGLRSN